MRTEATTAIGTSHRFCELWQYVLGFALVLWVLRVPLTTTALGLLILSAAPQAQDLFVELARATDERIPLFLFLLFFVWAMPTHYAARLLLDTDERFRRLVAQRPGTPEARRLEVTERWTPRVLGLLTFVAVLAGIYRSYANLPILAEAFVNASIGRALLHLGLMVFAAAAVFVVYTIKRPRTAEARVLWPIRSLARRLAPMWRAMSPGLQDLAGDRTEDRDVGRLLLVIIFVMFIAIFVFGADWAARQFPRALAIPLILGGWLPFLSYVSGVGRHLRAPLIVGLAALIVALTALVGDNHSVRRINAAETVGHPVDTTRMAFDQAVALWMQENGCSDTAGRCPRPIIVAGAGGASRAGFFTATVIGHLLQEAPAHGIDPNDVRRRLFAISGISGSSVGAVMIAAALDAKRDSTDHPCVQSEFPLWWGQTINNWRDCFEALTSGDFLTPVFVGFAFHDQARFGWWRDRGAILEDAWERRYREVIRRADRNYDSAKCSGLACPFLLLRPHVGHWIPLLVLNGTSEVKGNRIVTSPLRPYYAPRVPDDCPTSRNPQRAPDDCALFAEADHFHDLLDDDAKPETWKADFQRRLLADFWRRAALDDIRMSTAGHNSARFPIISPPGSIRNRQHQIVDRIVDGGYFEDYGALGAMELALAIRAVEPALLPFVLVISNDPDDLIDPADEVDAPASRARQLQQRDQKERKKRADVDDSEILTDVVTPITAFANTRTARGTLAVVQLRSALRRAMPGCRLQVTHVRVWPQSQETSSRSRAVSMSWWLSTPIQRHLHQQTEDTKNENDNGPRLEAVWQALGSKAGCAEAGNR